MDNVPSCFGSLYDHRAKECQICKRAIDCWSGFSAIHNKPQLKNGYALSVLNIIFQCRKATVDQIKEMLEERFKDKEINVYYYLNILKKKGLIDVRINGRQRFYTVR